MGRGSSKIGSNGSSAKFINSLLDYELRNIDRHFYMGNFGTKLSQIQFMKDNGVADSDIQEMNRLLYNHGLGPAAQTAADADIVSHLQANDSVGQALKMQIDMEEALYSRWMKSHPGGDDRVYRKGARKSGVEPWTIRPDGADMGQGGIGVDHYSSVKALMREGYHILGGMGRSLGAPGEGEITFVKY